MTIQKKQGKKLLFSVFVCAILSIALPLLAAATARAENADDSFSFEAVREKCEAYTASDELEGARPIDGRNPTVAFK